MMKQALQNYPLVGVVGFGLTGTAVVRFLNQQGKFPLIFDSRQSPPGQKQAPELVEKNECYFGEYGLENLLAVDLLVVSPGVDLRTGYLQMALDAEIPIISEIELFAWHVQAPVLAITGSNGKSTVATLLAYMLTQQGYRVGLGGNIGTPALSLLDQAYDYIVLELSSFQLEQTHTLAPKVASILNISPDHLDRYASGRAYTLAKQRIYRQAESVVWNKDDLETKPLEFVEVKENIGVVPLKQQSLTFSKHKTDANFSIQQQAEVKGNASWLCWKGTPLLAVKDLPLVGVHNQLNILAALAFCKALGIPLDKASKRVKGFQGLPHRCEVFLEKDGIRWINDSKSTNPGSTLAALEGLQVANLPEGELSETSAETQVNYLILIAGGDAKQIELTPLAPALKKVDALITLGKDGDKIAALKTGAIQVENLAQAVEKAKALASEYEKNSGTKCRVRTTVLLSPACSSLDMFKSFEDRGEQFQQAVRALYERI